MNRHPDNCMCEDCFANQRPVTGPVEQPEVEQQPVVLTCTCKVCRRPHEVTYTPNPYVSERWLRTTFTCNYCYDKYRSPKKVENVVEASDVPPKKVVQCGLPYKD